MQHTPEQEQQSKNKIPFEFIKKTYTELSKESKFIDAVTNVLNKGKVKSSLSAKTVMEDQYGFTIDSTLIKEISSDSYTSYTFLIHRSKSNESYFENLVVTVDSSATPKAYIIKYHLNSQPTYISEDDAYSLDAQTELTPINYNNAQAKVSYTANDGCTIVTLMCPHYDEDHPASQLCIDADRGNLFWSYDSSNCYGTSGGGGDSSSPSGNDSTTGAGDSISSGTTDSSNDPYDPNNHGNTPIISAPILEDEVIDDSIEDVPPSCESFNYSRVGTTNWQCAAVSNVHDLFTVINWDCIGYDWGIFTQPLYFQLPINPTYKLDSGNTKTESAAYLDLAFKAFDVWYKQNGCSAGGPALEQKLMEYIKDEFEENGGNVTLTPPSGFTGTSTSYKITWSSTYGNCN